MFAPNDISIQQINKVDAPAEKEWVMLIKLDWANKKGYLASQLQDGKDDNKCRKLNYLPHTEIGIHVFKDQAKCCEDSKNYWDCKKKGCSMERLMLENEDTPLSFKMSLTGSVFSWKLDEFMPLEGTKFTKPEGENALVLGNNLNDKSVVNIPGVLLELAGTSVVSKEIFDGFRNNAMAGEKSAKDVFKNVLYDGNRFTFQCGKKHSKRLCDELTSQSQRPGSPMKFEYEGKSFTLSGDGQYVFYAYDLGEGTKRRRLLQWKGSGS
eukprot:g6067.t1